MIYLIGIAGGSGSGKTTFAKKLLKNVADQVLIMHMDSYYLPKLPSHLLNEKGGKANFDHPEAFDWKLLTSHIEKLKEGSSIDIPVYDFKSSSRTQNVQTISPTKVVIFEGIFSLFNQTIREMLDIKVFLHVDADIRFTRRLDRDIKERGRSLDSVIEQYYQTVRPMHQKFLEPQKQYADFIVGEETDVGANILAAKVREVLSKDLTKDYAQ